jgi:hypothetical protein
VKPIPVTVYLPEQAAQPGRGDQVQGWPPGLVAAARVLRKEASVLPEELENNFRDFMSSMEVALKGIPVAVGRYEIDEIELALELTISGEIRLLAGAGIEGKAAITLTLKRPPTSPNAGTSET